MLKRKQLLTLCLLAALTTALIFSFWETANLKIGQAATIDEAIQNLDKTAQGSKLPTTMDNQPLDVPKFIGFILKRVLEVTGAIFFAYLVYGGFLWMMSQGEAKRIERGKDVIFWAITGLIIIFASYGLVFYVLTIFNQ